jgi:hypothetical protein
LEIQGTTALALPEAEERDSSVTHQLRNGRVRQSKPALNFAQLNNAELRRGSADNQAMLPAVPALSVTGYALLCCSKWP